MFTESKTNTEIDFLVNAYSLNGMGIEAVDLFHQMPVKFRDSWSYVCVLNGCSHAGLISQAWQIFEKIPIEVKSFLIYTTMVIRCREIFLFRYDESNFLGRYSRANVSFRTSRKLIEQIRDETSALLSNVQYVEFFFILK